MLKAKVTNVRDHVRQEVAALAVLSVSLETVELLGNGVHFLLLCLDNLLAALKHNSGSAEFTGVKAVVLGDVELLGLLNQRGQQATSSRLDTCQY